MVLIRRVLGVALFGGLLVVGWLFANANGDAVSVDYLIGQTSPRAVWLVLLAAWSAGLSMMGLYLGLVIVLARLESRRLCKAVQGLERELSGLRNKAFDTGFESDADSVASTRERPAALGTRGGSWSP